MAITRAQQVRQMLEDGGMLVSPSKDGKRPGYKRSKYDASGGGLRSSAAEKGSKGPTTPKGGGGGGIGSTKVSPSYGKDQYEGTTQAGGTEFVTNLVPGGNIPDEKLQKDLKDKLRRKNPSILERILPTRKGLFERGLLIPGAKDSITRQRLEYAKYLESMGIDPSEELEDTDDLFRFFEKKAFDKKRSYDKSSPDYEPNPADIGIFNPEIGREGTKAEEILNYGDFLLKEFGNPTVKYSGDIGKYNREMGFERGDNAPVITAKNITDPTDPTDPNQTTDIFARVAPRFAGSKFDFDALRRLLAEEQSAADGGRIGAAEGGIMDLETGRQMYFLGKLVKKATRAVKKITKSPLGKAALAFGAYKLGGGLFGKDKFFGTGFNPFKTGSPIGPLSSRFGKIASKFGLTDFVTGDLTLGGKIGLGSLALPFLMGDEEEEQDMNMGPELTMEQLRAIRNSPYRYTAPRFEGSQYKFAEGGEAKEPVAKKTMPLLDMGGKEMDLRAEGGFVPIGRMEKADDVPARLSKNEFVFTADAVRNAGEGDVDKGAEVMYNMMKNLESGGEVSEESQGLQGARDMFQTSKRLEEVL